MRRNREHRLPSHLEEIEERLLAEKVDASELELDRIKLEARARAERRDAWKGNVVLKKTRRSLITLTLVLGLVASGSGVVVATSDNGSSKGKSASKSQYKPGKGCGDKNHTHTGPPGNPENGPETCPPQSGKKK